MNDQRAFLTGPLRLLLVVIWIATSSTLGCSCFLKDRVNGISELEMEDDHGDSEVDFQDDFGPDEGEEEVEELAEEEDISGQGQDADEARPDSNQKEPEDKQEPEGEQAPETEADESEGETSGSGAQQKKRKPTDAESAARDAADLLSEAEQLAEDGDTEAAYQKASEALDLVYPHSEDDEACDELRRKAIQITEKLDGELEQNAPDVDEPVKVR